MYILCSKEEFRSLVANCAKSARMKHGLVSCKSCVLRSVCMPSIHGMQPGDMLTQLCLIVRPGEDAVFTNNDSLDEEIE